MAEKEKHDVHLLANSPFIINEQKVAFVISACFHAGHSLARQAADSDSYGTSHTRYYLARRQRLWPKSGCFHWRLGHSLVALPLTNAVMSVHTKHSSAQNKYTQCVRRGQIHRRDSSPVCDVRATRLLPSHCVSVARPHGGAYESSLTIATPLRPLTDKMGKRT